MRAVVVPLVLASLMGSSAAEKITDDLNADAKLNDMFDQFNEMKNKPLCPMGHSPVLRKPLHEMGLVANGCGAAGQPGKADGFGLHVCCNAHDICYSLCGASFSWCEKEFSSCLQGVCTAHADPVGCKEKANGFSEVTQSMGFGFWRGGQYENCECVNDQAVATRQHITLADFYKYRLAQEGGDVSEASVKAKQTIRQWKGKEGKLYMSLALKYGVALEFVKFDNIGADLPDPSTIGKRKKAKKRDEL